MKVLSIAALIAALALSPRFAQAELKLSYGQALALGREHAPSIAVARAQEGVVEAESRVGAIYPNPTLLAGTSTQTAKFSVGASLPLIILGQRQAALEAGRAELATSHIETQISWVAVRAATAHAFVGLWLAERTAAARAGAAELAASVENGVKGRVELGAAPELDGLRAHAERVRAGADAEAARDLVDASAAELGAWIGEPRERVRTDGDPELPSGVPSIAELLGRVPTNPTILRADAELRATEARAASERAQLRPALMLDIGADLFDPTLPTTNYRAGLGVELPLFNQRGPLIEREERRGGVARSERRAEQVRLRAELLVAYRTFAALTRQAKVLEKDVVPAMVAATAAALDSYGLGRAPLSSVLEAQRARIEAELSLIEARGARANSWIDVERAVGFK